MTATLDPPSDDLITLSVVTTDTSARVHTTGEVDSTSASQLHAELDAQLDAGVRELIIDLAGVTFLDSAGLCALAAVHRRLSSAMFGSTPHLSHRAVIRPLQITGLWDLFGAEQIAPAN